MNSFNRWKQTKKFYEMNANPALGNIGAPMGNSSTPDPNLGAAPAANLQPNMENPNQQMNAVQDRTLERLGNILKNKNVNYIMQFQSGFNKLVQDLLNQKSTTVGKRFNLQNYKQAQNMYRNKNI